MVASACWRDLHQLRDGDGLGRDELVELVEAGAKLLGGGGWIDLGGEIGGRAVRRAASALSSAFLSKF